MAARLPLRTLLRDIVMMLCGSVLGLLLAQGFVHHDLRMVDVSHLCGAVQMTKKVVERSKVGDQPFLFLSEGSGSGGEERRGERGHAGSTSNVERSGWSLEVQGSGDAVRNLDKTKHQDIVNHQDKAKYQDTTKHSSHNANILVGVVTEDSAVSKTVQTVMETWGQSSNDIVFYSLSMNSTGGRKEESVWAWHGKRHKRHYENGNPRVIEVKSEISKSSTRTTRLLPMLQHMYRNLLNRYDWFVLIPQDTYVQLKQTEGLLVNSDPSQVLVLGHPADQDSGSGVGGGGCEEGRGVVFSRQLLRELGRVLEGVCQEEAWHCIHNHTKIKCRHDNQVNQLFTDTTTLPSTYLNLAPSDIATPTSPTHFLYALHQDHLLEELSTSMTKTNAIREKLARNEQKLTRHKTIL